MKAKIFSLVTTFVLLVSLLVVGVWAIRQIDFSVTGEVKFETTGVDATISCTGLENGTLTDGTLGVDKLTDVKIDTSLTKQDLLKTFSPWQSLKLAFDEKGNDILLKLRIKNDNDTNFINATVSAEAGTSNNCTVVATNDVEESTNVYIFPGEYTDYTITFSITNKKEDASLSGFGITVKLKHVGADTVQSVSDYEGTLIFTCNETTKTASVKAANTSITSAEIPTYVKTANNVICKVNTIEEHAFSSCTNLTNISIPNSVNNIETGAFLACSELKTITIPNSVTTLGVGIVANCNKLTTIVVENGNSVFDSRDNCNAIINTKTNTLVQGCQNTAIPSNVTSIGTYAFYHCESLTNAIIPDSVLSIEEYAFEGCSGLTSLTIGKSVKSIGDWAFLGCKSLTSITIPDSVTSIGYGAFQSCYELTSVTIGKSVTSIGSMAFAYCQELSEINYLGDINSWVSISFGSSTANPTYYAETLKIQGEVVTSIIIDTANKINDCAFCYCKSLTSVTIGSAVTSIEISAFEGCDNIEKVFIDSASVASQLSGKSSAGGLLNNFDYLYIKNSILSSLNSYVKNNYEEEFQGDSVITDSYHVAGYTYYCTSTTVMPEPVDPTDPDPGTSFA